MTENFDTSSVITNDDIELANQIKHIKKHIYAYLKMDKIVDITKEIIDKSEVLGFKNERVKKFIDVKRPIYYILIDREKALKKYPLGSSKFSNEKEESDYFTNIIYKEIISNFTEAIIERIRKEKYSALEEIRDNNLFQGLDDEQILSQVRILSSIFGIRLDKDNNADAVVEMLI